MSNAGPEYIVNDALHRLALDLAVDVDEDVIDDLAHAILLGFGIKEGEHALTPSAEDYVEKRATCRCGWRSPTFKRRVDSIIAWQVHAGRRPAEALDH